MRDGIDWDTEIQYRIYGCDVIQEAGQHMKFPQVVMITAQNLLHRFYYRKTIKQFDPFCVAMGSLLLAAKLEEQSKILREVVFNNFLRYYFINCDIISSFLLFIIFINFGKG